MLKISFLTAEADCLCHSEQQTVFDYLCKSPVVYVKHRGFYLHKNETARLKYKMKNRDNALS